MRVKSLFMAINTAKTVVFMGGQPALHDVNSSPKTLSDKTVSYCLYTERDQSGIVGPRSPDRLPRIFAKTNKYGNFYLLLA